ncbi:hypothetical protein NECID01_0751 [Nematocida sp. AWRm77]|nr:hypothetical protein NECID01_0751 [Nematocida sp. AWRm77]
MKVGRGSIEKRHGIERKVLGFTFVVVASVFWSIFFIPMITSILFITSLKNNMEIVKIQRLSINSKEVSGILHFAGLASPLDISGDTLTVGFATSRNEEPFGKIVAKTIESRCGKSFEVLFRFQYVMPEHKKKIPEKFLMQLENHILFTVQGSINVKVFKLVPGIRIPVVVPYSPSLFIGNMKPTHEKLVDSLGAFRSTAQTTKAGESLQEEKKEFPLILKSYRILETDKDFIIIGDYNYTTRIMPAFFCMEMPKTSMDIYLNKEHAGCLEIHPHQIFKGKAVRTKKEGSEEKTEDQATFIIRGTLKNIEVVRKALITYIQHKQLVSVTFRKIKTLHMQKPESEFISQFLIKAGEVCKLKFLPALRTVHRKQENPLVEIDVDYVDSTGLFVKYLFSEELFGFTNVLKSLNAGILPRLCGVFMLNGVHIADIKTSHLPDLANTKKNKYLAIGGITSISPKFKAIQDILRNNKGPGGKESTDLFTSMALHITDTPYPLLSTKLLEGFGVRWIAGTGVSVGFWYKPPEPSEKLPEEVGAYRMRVRMKEEEEKSAEGLQSYYHSAKGSPACTHGAEMATATLVFPKIEALETYMHVRWCKAKFFLQVGKEPFEVVLEKGGLCVLISPRTNMWALRRKHSITGTVYMGDTSKTNLVPGVSFLKICSFEKENQAEMGKMYVLDKIFRMDHLPGTNPSRQKEEEKEEKEEKEGSPLGEAEDKWGSTLKKFWSYSDVSIHSPDSLLSNCISGSVRIQNKSTESIERVPKHASSLIVEIIVPETSIHINQYPKNPGENEEEYEKNLRLSNLVGTFPFLTSNMTEESRQRMQENVVAVVNVSQVCLRLMFLEQTKKWSFAICDPEKVTEGVKILKPVFFSVHFFKHISLKRTFSVATVPHKFFPLNANFYRIYKTLGEMFSAADAETKPDTAGKQVQGRSVSTSLSAESLNEDIISGKVGLEYGDTQLLSGSTKNTISMDEWYINVSFSPRDSSEAVFEPEDKEKKEQDSLVVLLKLAQCSANVSSEVNTAAVEIEYTVNQKNLFYLYKRICIWRDSKRTTEIENLSLNIGRYSKNERKHWKFISIDKYPVHYIAIYPMKMFSTADASPEGEKKEKMEKEKKKDLAYPFSINMEKIHVHVVEEGETVLRLAPQNDTQTGMDLKLFNHYVSLYNALPAYTGERKIKIISTGKKLAGGAWKKQAAAGSRKEEEEPDTSCPYANTMSNYVVETGRKKGEGKGKGKGRGKKGEEERKRLGLRKYFTMLEYGKKKKLHKPKYSPTFVSIMPHFKIEGTILSHVEDFIVSALSKVSENTRPITLALDVQNLSLLKVLMMGDPDVADMIQKHAEEEEKGERCIGMSEDSFLPIIVFIKEIKYSFSSVLHRHRRLPAEKDKDKDKEDVGASAGAGAEKASPKQASLSLFISTPQSLPIFQVPIPYSKEYTYWLQFLRLKGKEETQTGKAILRLINYIKELMPLQTLWKSKSSTLEKEEGPLFFPSLEKKGLLKDLALTGSTPGSFEKSFFSMLEGRFLPSSLMDMMSTARLFRIENYSNADVDSVKDKVGASNADFFKAKRKDIVKRKKDILKYKSTGREVMESSMNLHPKLLYPEEFYILGIEDCNVVEITSTIPLCIHVEYNGNLVLLVSVIMNKHPSMPVHLFGVYVDKNLLYQILNQEIELGINLKDKKKYMSSDLSDHTKFDVFFCIGTYKILHVEVFFNLYSLILECFTGEKYNLTVKSLDPSQEEAEGKKSYFSRLKKNLGTTLVLNRNVLDRTIAFCLRHIFKAYNLFAEESTGVTSQDAIFFTECLKKLSLVEKMAKKVFRHIKKTTPEADSTAPQE